MALLAFANLDDLEARGVDTEAVGAALRAQAALDDASSLIRSYIGNPDVDALAEWYQSELRRITVAVARRVLENPESLQAHNLALGDASEAKTYASTSNDVYLTSAEKESLLQIATPAGGVRGLASIRMVAPAEASGTRYGWEEDQLIESDT